DLTVGYAGSVSLIGDSSIDLDAVLVKWEPSGGEPGKQGAGTFWFYSNVIPEYGAYSDILIAKNGRNVTYGDMEGAWPSCSVTPHVPEPATFGLLIVGMVAVAARRRRA
ncbi:MAG: PEP-CTERM sorting domain-containing protein, partial [Acidobacteria bacterium]|nr:PEP-CTERM sorting domain-containing protein [Acidobacteriota bacterium]